MSINGGKNKNFTVVRANIVNLNIDTVVLPANEQLHEGSGASRAIFKAAGRMSLTKACKEIGHCNMGSAVPTLGYNLKSKYIIINWGIAIAQLVLKKKPSKKK